MNRRTAGLVVIVLIAVVIGSLREYLFVNLNYQIDHLANGTAYSYAHSRFQLQVSGLHLQDLIRLKWFLAIAFVLVSLLLSIALARLLFGDHRYTRAIVFGFVAIGCLSFIFNWFSNGADGWYNISIKLLHAIQYPVILLFIWGAYQLSRMRRQG
jgi:cell division protein FtsW (lipid II flippase)